MFLSPTLQICSASHLSPILVNGSTIHKIPKMKWEVILYLLLYPSSLDTIQDIQVITSDHQTLLCYLRASRSLIASNYSPKGSLFYMLHTTLRMVFVKWSLLVIPSCPQDHFQSPWLQSSHKAGLYLKLQPYLNIINHLQFCCLQATKAFSHTVASAWTVHS